jgi:hypothetical protein
VWGGVWGVGWVGVGWGVGWGREVGGWVGVGVCGGWVGWEGGELHHCSPQLLPPPPANISFSPHSFTPISFECALLWTCVTRLPGCWRCGSMFCVSRSTPHCVQDICRMFSQSPLPPPHTHTHTHTHTYTHIHTFMLQKSRSCCP